jgi:hypothetical protein
VEVSVREMTGTALIPCSNWIGGTHISKTSRAWTRTRVQAMTNLTIQKRSTWIMLFG